MKGKMLGMLLGLAAISGAPAGNLFAGGSGPPPKKDPRKDPNDYEPGSWVPYQQLDFTDTTVALYNIDTRDFHGRGNDTYGGEMPWQKKCEKNPDWYIHTADEVLVLLKRLKEESGGDVEWRFLTLTGVFRTQNWELKYIRIYRCYQGLLVCNDNGFIFSKADLKSPVDKERLNAH